MAGYVEKRGDSYRLIVVTGYTSNGNKIRKTKTVKTKSKKKAKMALADFVVEIEKGEYISPEKMKFVEFVKEWEEKYAKHHLSETTIYNYTKTLQARIIPYFGDKQISHIKTMHVLNYLDELYAATEKCNGRPGKLSAATIELNHKILNSIFKRAVEWGLIKNNPVKGVSKPKTSKGKSSVYNAEEVAIVEKALRKETLQWRLLILLVITTGLRRGEVAGLEWKHIDLEKQFLEVKQTSQNISKKGHILKEPKTGKTRKIFLTSGVVEILKIHREEGRENQEKWGDQWEGGLHEYVFPSSKGNPLNPSSITRWWSRFIRRNNLPQIRFHDLRHTSATILLNQGTHAKVISERLGHSDIKTTMNIYGHVLEPADKEAATQFDHFFSS